MQKSRLNCLNCWQLTCLRVMLSLMLHFETVMRQMHHLRQDPLESILVLFGHNFLIFFVWKVLEIWKMTPLLCACAVVITLEAQKRWKRAPHFVKFNFLTHRNRRKWFSQNERRRADLQDVASDLFFFLFFFWPRTNYDLSKFNDNFSPCFSTLKDHNSFPPALSPMKKLPLNSFPLEMHAYVYPDDNQHKKHLGLNFTGNREWSTHLSTVLSKTHHLLGLLKRLKESGLNKQALSSIYKLHICPQLEYASTAWSNLTQQQSDTLERFQRKAAKIILGYRLSDHLNHTYLLSAVEWDTLSSGRALQIAALGFKLFVIQRHPISSPRLLHDTPSPKPLRHSRVFAIPLSNTEANLKSPILPACHLFNSLPHNIQSATSCQQFMSLASPHFLSTRWCCSAHIPQRPFFSTNT